MSHILHFYHLVALDYVSPRAVLAGIPTPLNRPFLCPRYDEKYYITTQRILAIAGIPGAVTPACLATLSSLPGWGAPGNDPGGAVNAYLTGQYLKALDMRRMCHEMLAIYAGRAALCSGFTPGGITATITQKTIDQYRSLLNKVIAFIGAPTDFANGIAGTMMFDTVAAAHLFPEYFWIGQSYSQFMAYGVFENGFKNGISNIIGGQPTTDNRGLRRGYKLSAQSGATRYNVDMMKIKESIGYSRYSKDALRNYPDGIPFKHPWDGVTGPDPYADNAVPNGYSWLKSPRYDIGSGNYQPFEVGPLARQVVEGNYYGGVLNALGYTLTPVWNQNGPNISNGSGHPLEAVYAAIPGVNGGPNLSGVQYKGDSTLDRIAARTVETLVIALLMNKYLTQIQNTLSGGYGASGCTEPDVPISGTETKGYGMTEASRGALGHWIKMQNGVVTRYQAIVPTTWNANPRDVLGQEGPAERSLQGNAAVPHPTVPLAAAGSTWVANPNEPIELPRVTHSYDFCIACAVHLISPKGEVIKVDVPALP